MKPILFVVTSEPSYKIHKPFAEFCARQGRAIAFVYDRQTDTFFETVSGDARAFGATIVSLDSEIGSGPHESPWGFFSRPPERAKYFDAVRRNSQSARTKPFSDILFGRYHASLRVLKRIKPGVMVVPEDGISGPLMLTTAARKLGIPIADLPYGHGTQKDLELALERKRADGELLFPEGPEGDAIKARAPEWLKRGPFEGAILLPSEYIVVLESLDARLRNAWIVHGGFADRLMVESPRMMALYRSEGIPEAKLALVGTIYGDFLLDSIDAEPAARAAFRTTRKIDPARTRILVSWPPSYHSERASHSEYASYADMTRDFFDWARQLRGASLTVSLHPAVSAEDRRMIAELGVETTDEYVLSLIPRHDIYVTYFSSTIRWAIASGKPVINYDAYKLNLPIYEAAPGVRTLAEMREVKSVIEQAVHSDDVFAQLASPQVDAAPEWGMLDARAMPRILAELDAIAR